MSNVKQHPIKIKVGTEVRSFSSGRGYGKYAPEEYLFRTRVGIPTCRVVYDPISMGKYGYERLS